MPSLKEILAEARHEISKADGNKNYDSAIVAVKSGTHTHVHYPKDSEALPIVRAIMKEKGISSQKSGNKLERIDASNRKIIFSHRRAIGDAIMFSSGIRDFKLLFPEIRIGVDSNQSSVWENNPYIDRSLNRNDEGVEFYRVGYPMIGNANNTAMHFSTSFLFDMIAVADLNEPLPIRLGEFTAAFGNGRVGDPSYADINKNPEAKEPFISLRDKYNSICKNFVRQRGDIHLSDDEKSTNLIRNTYGIEKYWVIAPGGKRDCTTKIWDWRKFQDVIDYYDGRIKFVVVGRSDLLVEKLNNVIDLTDKFNGDVRGVYPLVYHSEGCVTGVSFIMHLAAAMPPRIGSERKPCVSIYGGREPTSFTWYCNHQILHTNGAFTCCDNGGCWNSRTIPLQKDPNHNRRLCKHTVSIDGRTVQACMDSITSDDVIRSIGKYYDGNIYVMDKKPFKEIKLPEIRINTEENLQVTTSNHSKEINLLGSLKSSGGGEQSLITLADILRKGGWKVNLYPWDSVHENYAGDSLMKATFKNGMKDVMVSGVPLLFYANDQIWDFVKEAKPIVDKSSSVIVGINFCNGTLPKSDWLARSGKLKGVVFQNTEKRDEFERDEIGFNGTKKIVLFGAVDIDRFYEVCPPKRNGRKDELVVLKHCKPDYRKYVTEESAGSGEKIHVWQKKVFKDKDVKFYGRLLKDTDNIRFEFMQAHKEVVKAFKGEKRMVFHDWNSMPVTDFLAKGHVYLYRTSNAWRDQYPRVVAEALVAGLPVLTEPRDGTKDRVIHGDTGFYCIDYDGFLYALKMLQRKEDYRHHMGRYAKDWAKINLDPRKWVETIDSILQ